MSFGITVFAAQGSESLLRFTQPKNANLAKAGVIFDQADVISNDQPFLHLI